MDRRTGRCDAMNGRTPLRAFLDGLPAANQTKEPKRPERKPAQHAA
jgi:hypothetical protein